MIGLAPAPDIALLAVMFFILVSALVLIAVVHIRGTPARLLAQAELERARAGLPSTLEARLNIDLKENETRSSG